MADKVGDRTLSDLVTGAEGDSTLRQLKDEYHAGDMTERKFSDTVNWYTNQRLQVGLEKDGYLATVWQETVRQANEEWLKFKESISKLAEKPASKPLAP